MVYEFSSQPGIVPKLRLWNVYKVGLSGRVLQLCHFANKPFYIRAYSQLIRSQQVWLHNVPFITSLYTYVPTYLPPCMKILVYHVTMYLHSYPLIIPDPYWPSLYLSYCPSYHLYYVSRRSKSPLSVYLLQPSFFLFPSYLLMLRFSRVKIVMYLTWGANLFELSCLCNEGLF